MFFSTGVLKYSTNPYKLIVEVDNSVASYYRSLAPKFLHIKKPLYSAHISVVRNIVPPNLEQWGRWQNRVVSFEYDSYVYNDELYYWLNVYSWELEQVRQDLGLKPYGDVTWSPDGRHRFHLTIGNLK